MASKAFQRIQGLFEGEVRFRANSTKDIQAVRGRIRRVVSGAPEVMVKVSSFGKGIDHVKAHLDYIGRKGKLELEDERGNKIVGKSEVAALNQDWMADGGKRRKNTRDTSNIILSMPPGTHEKAMEKAVRNFSKSQFGQNHQYVWVMHDDEKHPHAHLTVKNLGFDGKRLHIAKGDPQRWRELFAEKLREQGIEASASSRLVRGVVKKSALQDIQHIRERGEIPKVDRARVKEVAEELTGKRSVDKPWETTIKDRQVGIRKDWVLTAQELSSSTDQGDKQLAGDILRFIKTMPPLQTERHEIRQKLSAQLQVQEQDLQL